MSPVPGNRRSCRFQPRRGRRSWSSQRAILAALTPELAFELASRGATRDLDAVARATASAAAKPKSRIRKDWSIVPDLTTTYSHQDEDEQGIVQLSGTGDLGLPPFSTKYTTDFTGTDVFGDQLAFGGNRNWVINVGNAKSSRRALRPEASIGYAPPDFFRNAQLVTSSMARG